MRDLKCRGINSVNNKMIYGYYFKSVHTDSGHALIALSGFPSHSCINENTLGQTTNLFVEGGELFEGDVIRDHVGIGVVVWSKNNVSLKVSYRGEDEGTGKWFSDYLESEFSSIEIIGNIHQVNSMGIIK